MAYKTLVLGESKGLVTDHDPAMLDNAESPDCLNVEFDELTIRKRNGARKVNSLAIGKGGLAFDGVSGWVFIPDSDNYDGLEAALTIELTYKPTTVAGAAGEQVLFCRTNTAAAAGSRASFVISQVQSGGVERFRFRYTAGGTERTLTDTSTTVVAGTRYHVVATFVDGQQNIFVTDLTTGTTGTTSRTDAGALLDLDVPLLMGAISRTATGQVDFTDATYVDDEPVAGVLDEVRLWAATLASGSTPAAALSTYRDRELDTAHANAASLRGYWKLNDRSSVTANDDMSAIRGSGTDNNGFLEPRRPQYQTGMVPDEQGYALQLDGYDDRGFVPTDNSIAAVVRTGYNAHFAAGAVATIRPVWCIEMAVIARASALSQNIFRWVTDGASNNSICVITTDGAGIVTVTVSFQDSAGANDGTITLTSTTTVVVDTEIHIAVVRELDVTPTSTFRLFINGAEEDSETTAGAFTRGPDGNNTGILIARSTALDSSDAITIDELRIWSDAQTADADVSPRTAAEILQYFDKPLPAKEQFQAVSGTAAGTGFKLIHYWTFDENTRDYNDAPVRVATGAEANVFANIAARDFGQTQQDDIGGTLVILGGLSMQLLPGTHVPEWTPGLLRGSVQGGLIDLISEYATPSGEDELVIAGEGALFSFDGTSLPGALTTLKGSGFQGGRPASRLMVGERLYLTNGLAPPLVYDGTEVRRWGIQGPTRQPIFVRSSGSGVAGDVQYRYTYVSRESGVESDPSPPSAVYRDSTASLPAFNVFHSADPQVDTIRIYRTLHGATTGAPKPGSANFFFLDEVTNTPGLTTPTSYTDSVGDASLGDPLDSRDGFATSGPPPWCQYAVVFNDRVWMANEPRDEKSRSILFYSESGAPEEFGILNVFPIESGKGEPITGLGVLFDRLFIFKRSSIFVLSGFDEGSFRVQQLTTGLGCISHFSILAIDGWLYFLSNRGPYRTNGTTLEWIGKNIYSSFLDFAKDSIDLSTTGHNRNRHQVWFAMRRTGQSSNDRVLVFDYHQEIWTLFSNLWPQVVEGIIDSEGLDRIFWGDDYGFVWRGDANATFNQSDLGQSGTTFGNITGASTAGNLITLTVTGAFGASALSDGWKGCRVVVTDATDGTEAEARIASNTSTTLVLDVSTLGFTPVSGDGYKVGSIDAHYRTKPLALVSPAMFAAVEEIEIEGLFALDNNAPVALTQVRIEVGLSTEFSTDFDTVSATRDVTVGAAATEVSASERLNLKGRAKRVAYRVSCDFCHEGFAVRHMTITAEGAGRT